MRVWLQASIRRLQPTLRALMGFARNGLYYPARFERSASSRLLFLRSNRSRHHIVSTFATLERASNSCLAVLRSLLHCCVVLRYGRSFANNAQGCSRHFICQCNSRHVHGPPYQQLLAPDPFAFAFEQNGACSVSQKHSYMVVTTLAYVSNSPKGGRRSSQLSITSNIWRTPCG
jgi:hypothetical protein